MKITILLKFAKVLRHFIKKTNYFLFTGVSKHHLDQKKLNKIRNSSPAKQKNRENDLNYHSLSTNQLTSPLLTTEIDNYRDLLIDDEKRKKSLNLTNLNERELYFQMKQNEILTRKKLNLQGKNEHLNGDIIYLEGQNQILKQENEYLRRKLISFEKKSIDEMRIYQDRSLQLAENVNQMKWELEDMKNINDKNLKTFISSNEIINVLKGLI